MTEHSSSPPSLSQLLRLSPTGNPQPRPRPPPEQQPPPLEHTADEGPSVEIAANARDQGNTAAGRPPIPQSSQHMSRHALQHDAKRRRTDTSTRASANAPRRSMSSIECQISDAKLGESSRSSGLQPAKIESGRQSRFFRSPSMAELGIQQEQQEQQQQQEQNSGETNLLLTEEHAGTQTSDDFQSFPRNPRPAVQQQEAESQSPAVSLIRAPSSASSAVSILSEGVNSANGNGRLAHSDSAITRDGDNDPSSDSDDFVQPPVQAIPRAQPRAHEAETEATEEQLDTQPDSTSDERNACPICFEKWTISGNHQLTALKCGHLFGKSCIVKTDIQKNPINTKTGRRRNRIAKNDVVRCPECNQDGKWSEARRIFARSIVAVDDEKLAETRRQASELQKKQGELENDLAHYQLSFQQMRNEVVKLRNRLAEAFKKTQSLELENSNLTRHVGELTQQLLAATTSSCPADWPRPSCNDEVDLLQLNDADLKYIEANAGPGLGKEDNASDRVLGSPAVPERSLAQSRTMSMNSVETVELDAMAGARARTALDHSLGNDGPKAPDGQPTATHTYCPRLRLKATIPLNKGDTSVSSRLMAVHPYDDLVYATYSKRSTNFHTLAQVNVHDPASPPVVLEKMHSDEIRGAEVSPSISSTQYMLTASMDKSAVLTALGCPPASTGSAGRAVPAAPKRSNPMKASCFNLGAQGWSCAWDHSDQHLCYFGTTGGCVLAFDLRKTNKAVYTWNGPNSGSVQHTSSQLLADQRSGEKTSTGYSPIHGIAVIPCQHTSGKALSRLVVANTHHLYALPPMPSRQGLAELSASKESPSAASDPWIRLTGSGSSDSWHNRSCISISFDARLHCLAASFRSHNASRARITVHELFDIGFSDSTPTWSLRQQIALASQQNKWARSSIFSYQTEGPGSHLQGLFCAGVEETRSVTMWDACARVPSNLLTLNDVSKEDRGLEEIVDVKGWQWNWPNTQTTTMFCTLTNSRIRLYDVL